MSLAELAEESKAMSRSRPGLGRVAQLQVRSVSDLLGAMIATEMDDKSRFVGRSRRTEDGPGHEVTVRIGS